MAELDRQVKQTVIAWGRSPSLAEGEAKLTEARSTLPRELLEQLRDEIAEIIAVTLTRLLVKPDRPDEEEIEISGVAISARRARELSAWIEDQERTARALGLD